MPLAQQALLCGLACFAVIVVLWLAMSRSKRREELGDTGDLDPPERKAGKHPTLGVSYREGPILAFGPEEDHARDVYREFADRTAPRARAPFKTAITLTPRHLEHINILRRRDGKPLLNAAGFRNAIARQPVPLRSSDDWTGYLIAYAILSSEHEQSRVACEHTITIQPDAPFNGQGGEFAGAGASGSWPSGGGVVSASATMGVLGSATDAEPARDDPEPAQQQDTGGPDTSSSDTGNGGDAP